MTHSVALKSKHSKRENDHAYNDHEYVEKINMPNIDQQENKKYNCVKCNKTFSEEDKFITHHCNKVEMNQCEICHKIFRNAFNKKKHIECVHKNIKKYKCDYCGHSLKEAVQLRIHIIEKHEIKNGFKCDFCPKVFASESRKTNHIAITHVGIRKHGCDQCFKAFAHRSHLLQHIREVHLEDGNKKEFICQYCDKSLSSNKREILCLNLQIFLI